MIWEPWTGCYKVSDGCTYCYYYGPYSKRCGQNTVVKTAEFYKPIEGKIKSGANVDMCFTTDFFLPEADQWRAEVWQMIKTRSDVNFMFFTKRIERFPVSLPGDWGDGYDNVTIGCTVENQEMADCRLPLFLNYPIKNRLIICSPLLGSVDLAPYLHGVSHVTAAGEAGREARVCDLNWVFHIRSQCENAGISFQFRSTGSRLLKEGVVAKVNPYMQHRLAKEMGINL